MYHITLFLNQLFMLISEKTTNYIYYSILNAYIIFPNFNTYIALNNENEKFLTISANLELYSDI